ncbi:excalibur calcium-binding domain-containing protein [Prauserella shujinwangii]|uniref:excalibur calcium-binding domain-containing protein n=1 Tax=Prauserella shujinwangii TaxID=1453103 RepID=UPI003CCBB74D
MRRTLVLAATFAIAGFTYVGTASAQDDYDCGDFTYQEEAQQVFDSVPGDPYRLDANGDGVACEDLPSKPKPKPEPKPQPEPAPSTQDNPAPAATDTDKDCRDFASQDEAQAVLDADPSDPHRIDGDNDGIACEALLDGGESDQQVTVYPSGGVDTGGRGDGGQDGAALVTVGGIALAGAALVVRRRVRAGGRA